MKTSVLVIACLCWASVSAAVERRALHKSRRLSRGDYNVFHGDRKVHYATGILSDTGNKEKIRARIVEKKVPVPYTVEKKVPFIVEKKVPYKVKIPVHKPYIVEKKVPYPVKEYVKVPYYVPKPYPVIKKIPYQVEVPIPRPYEVKVPVPQPYTVEKKVPVPVKVYVPQPYTVEKKVPYPVKVVVPVPQPYTVEKKVPYEVKVPVDRPYIVHVPKPYPVYYEEHVPVTVEQHVPYEVKVPVDKPYPVEVSRPAPYKVKIPVPIPVTVRKKVPFHIQTNIPIPVRTPVDRPLLVVNKVPDFIEKEVAYPIYHSEHHDFSEDEASNQHHAEPLIGEQHKEAGEEKLVLLSDEVWQGQPHLGGKGFEYPIEKPLGVPQKTIEDYKSQADWKQASISDHHSVRYTNSNAWHAQENGGHTFAGDGHKDTNNDHAWTQNVEAEEQNGATQNNVGDTNWAQISGSTNDQNSWHNNNGAHIPGGHQDDSEKENWVTDGSYGGQENWAHNHQRKEENGNEVDNHEWVQPGSQEHPDIKDHNAGGTFVSKDLVNNGWENYQAQPSPENHLVVNEDAAKTWAHPVEIHLENNQQSQNEHQEPKPVEQNNKYETLPQPEKLIRFNQDDAKAQTNGKPQEPEIIYGRGTNTVRSRHRSNQSNLKPVQEYPIYVANYGAQSVRADYKVAESNEEQNTSQPSTTNGNAEKNTRPENVRQRNARMHNPEVWEHPATQDWTQPDVNGWRPVESSNERKYYDERS